MEKQGNFLVISACEHVTNLFPLDMPSMPFYLAPIGKSGESMLQMTIRNLSGIAKIPRQNVVVVCDAKYREFVRKKLSSEIPNKNIISPDEPYGETRGMMHGVTHLYRTKETKSEAMVICTSCRQLLRQNTQSNELLVNSIEYSRNSGRPILFDIPGVNPAIVDDCTRGYIVRANEWMQNHNGYSYSKVIDYSFHSEYEKRTEDPQLKALYEASCSGCNSNSGVLIAPISVIGPIAARADYDRAVSFQMRELIMELRRSVIGMSPTAVISEPNWTICERYEGLHAYFAEGKDSNSLLGQGNIRIHNCSNSLIYADEGVNLTVDNIKDEIVMIRRIGDQIFYLISAFGGNYYSSLMYEIYSERDPSSIPHYQLAAFNNCVITNITEVDRVFGVCIEVKWHQLHITMTSDGAIHAEVRRCHPQ